MDKKQTLSIRISNAAFFFWWSELEDLAEEHGIEPTKRQASKFKRGRGLLWKVYQQEQAKNG